MEVILKRHRRIPVSEPNIGRLERKYLVDAFDSTWISSRGSYISKFEKEFARYIGTDYSSTCSNGTTALHLALKAIGVRRGDEVIVPNLTFVATANSVLYCGAKPVFADVSNIDWNIDINDTLKLINDRTVAIICVHLYGKPCDMNKLVSLCNRKKIILIEDCAQAIGSKYNDKMCGSFGHLSTFSFFGNKTITTGEGGMVCSNNKEYIDRINHLKNQSMLEGYYHTELGYNYRMTNLQAAIGCAQLKRISTILRNKQRIYGRYEKYLDSSKFTLQPSDGYSVHSRWMNAIMLRVGDKNSFISYMNEHNIECKSSFRKLSSLPYFDPSLKLNSVELSSRIVCLPSGSTLTNDDIRYVCETANSYS